MNKRVETITSEDCGGKRGVCPGCSRNAELRPAGKEGALTCFNCAIKDMPSMLTYLSKRIGVDFTGKTAQEIVVEAIRGLSLYIDALSDVGIYVEKVQIKAEDEDGDKSLSVQADYATLCNLLGEDPKKQPGGETFPITMGHA